MTVLCWLKVSVTVMEETNSGYHFQSPENKKTHSGETGTGQIFSATTHSFPTHSKQNCPIYGGIPSQLTVQRKIILRNESRKSSVRFCLATRKGFSAETSSPGSHLPRLSLHDVLSAYSLRHRLFMDIYIKLLYPKYLRLSIPFLPEIKENCEFMMVLLLAPALPLKSAVLSDPGRDFMKRRYRNERI